MQMITSFPRRQNGLFLSLFLIAFCCSCRASSTPGTTPLTRVSIVVPENLLVNGTAELHVMVDYELVISGDAEGKGGRVEKGIINIPLIATNSYDANGGRMFTSSQVSIPVGATIKVELYSGPIANVVKRATYEGTYDGGGMITLET